MVRSQPTIKEQGFALAYFDTRNKVYSMKKGGYPADAAGGHHGRAVRHADVILARPRVQAYLRKLWEKAESPICMSIRERKEILSQIARGMIGNCIDENGQVDLTAIRDMPAVKEINIIDWRSSKKVPDMQYRQVKIKLLNPVESIHELNLMEKLARANQQTVNINPVNNYYVTGPEVVEKLGRISERTAKQIALTGEKENEETEE